MTVVPGEGVKLNVFGGSSVTLRFKGQIAQGYSNNAVAQRWSMRSSLIPQAGRLVTDLAFPVLNGESIVRRESGSEVAYTFNGSTWSPFEPQLAAGEGFRSYKANSGLDWYRNFLVWP
jgi:hypothetical protein